MKVTIRDADRPDTVIGELPPVPHLGLPRVGDRIRLARRGWNPTQPHMRVVDVLWDFDAEDTGEPEVRMLVTAG